LLSIFKFYRKWKRVGEGHGREKASIKKKPQGLFPQVKTIPLELFLTLFFIFFSFVRCKNNEKNSFKKTETTIYILHPFGSCPCVFAKMLSSLYMYKLF